MSKPSAEVHAGRLSVLLQALMFFVTNVLKDLDPLVDEIYHNSSKWADQSLAYRVSFQPTRPQLQYCKNFCCM